ncbi:MAG: FRG domain-containing protein [Moraxellaceae bacterium]|nr:FRG domain-containing protein [Moraxellaceae bacterium]
MKSQIIGSFGEFVVACDAFEAFADQTIFRGQPVKGNLIPSVARWNHELDSTDVEIEMLNEIKVLGASLLSGTESDLDLLVKAQHFGLKTRLLDWTSNPLAALWFACVNAEPNDADGYVYALDVDTFLLGAESYEKSPFQVAKTGVLRPRLTNERILAQHGWFTLHRYSTRDRKFVPLEKNPDTRGRLYEFRIPAAQTRDMLRALDKFGVSARTLFPDLNGLCLYLNRKSSHLLYV